MVTRARKRLIKKEREKETTDFELEATWKQSFSVSKLKGWPANK